MFVTTSMYGELCICRLPLFARRLERTGSPLLASITVHTFQENLFAIDDRTKRALALPKMQGSKTQLQAPIKSSCNSRREAPLASFLAQRVQPASHHFCMPAVPAASLFKVTSQKPWATARASEPRRFQLLAKETLRKGADALAEAPCLLSSSLASCAWPVPTQDEAVWVQVGQRLCPHGEVSWQGEHGRDPKSFQQTVVNNRIGTERWW